VWRKSNDAETNSSLASRIFISSIMSTEFRELRDRAEHAIRNAGCEPVRAENHPAASISPHTACLDMVESCDGVVLILGAKYGRITETDQSATEDEYREAVRLKKPVFAFVQRGAGEPEPRQDVFVASITKYVGGNWRKSFSTPEELTTLIEQSLREGLVPKMTIDQEQAAANHITEALSPKISKGGGLAWVHTAWSPLRNEDIVKPTELVKPEFSNKLLALGHGEDRPLFSYTEAKHTDPNSSRLRIEQITSQAGRGKADLVAVEFYKNGTLSILANVTGLHHQDDAIGWGTVGYYIDPDDVKARLIQAWAFAAKLWEHLDPFGRYNDMLYNVALRELGFHKFGKAPQNRGASFSMRTMNGPNMVLAHDTPKRIIRTDLITHSAEIVETIELLELRLKEIDRNSF
jgi:hypothetical protein